MPFIDSKITVSVPEEKRETIKSRFGQATSAAYSQMSGEVCKILEEELGIPGDRVYVTYREVSDWGWNGRNF